MTYIQAELPMIINTGEQPFLDYIVEEFGTGLSIPTAEFSEIGTRLSAAMTDKMPQRLEKAKLAMAFRREALANLVLPDKE